MSEDQQIEILYQKEKCKGYGNCVPILPEAFELVPGAATATMLRATFPIEMEDEIKQAVRACPARAIKMKKT